VYSALAILAVLEVVIDVRIRQKLTWKRPVMIAKFMLIICCACALSALGREINDSIWWSVTEYTAANAIVEAIGIATFACCYFLTTINWLTMIMKAKQLTGSNPLTKFRLAVFIISCILIPIFFIAFVLHGIQILTDEMSKVAQATELTFLLLILGGTSYHIIAMFIWAKKNAKQSASKVFKVVVYRSKFLIAINILLVFVLVKVIIDVTFYPPTAWHHFARKFAVDSLLCMIGVCLFFVVENYFTARRFPRGYISGLRGHFKARTISSTKKTAIKTSEKDKKGSGSHSKESSGSKKSSRKTATSKTLSPRDTSGSPREATHASAINAQTLTLTNLDTGSSSDSRRE